MLVFWLDVVACIMAFFIVVEICDLTGVTLYFFLVALMVLSLVAGVFFSSLVHSYWCLNFFYLSFFLVDSVVLSYRGIDFKSFVLGFSE